MTIEREMIIKLTSNDAQTRDLGYQSFKEIFRTWGVDNPPKAIDVADSFYCVGRYNHIKGDYQGLKAAITYYELAIKRYKIIEGGSFKTNILNCYKAMIKACWRTQEKTDVEKAIHISKEYKAAVDAQKWDNKIEHDLECMYYLGVCMGLRVTPEDQYASNGLLIKALAACAALYMDTPNILRVKINNGLGANYLHMGGVENLLKSTQYFKDAVNEGEKLSMDGRNVIATSYCELGTTYTQLSCLTYTEQLEYLKEALKNYKYGVNLIQAGNDDSNNLLLARMCQGVSDIHCKLTINEDDEIGTNLRKYAYKLYETIYPQGNEFLNQRLNELQKHGEPLFNEPETGNTPITYSIQEITHEILICISTDEVDLSGENATLSEPAILSEV